VERQNLTMRMRMRRFTRFTNGFSKKLENHVHALPLYFAHYNWMRIHKTLRVTPAMAAGLTGKLAGWEDIVAIMDAEEKDTLARKRAAMLDELPYSNRDTTDVFDDDFEHGIGTACPKRLAGAPRLPAAPAPFEDSRPSLPAPAENPLIASSTLPVQISKGRCALHDLVSGLFLLLAQNRVKRPYRRLHRA